MYTITGLHSTAFRCPETKRQHWSKSAGQNVSAAKLSTAELCWQQLNAPDCTGVRQPASRLLAVCRRGIAPATVGRQFSGNLTHLIPAAGRPSPSLLSKALVPDFPLIPPLTWPGGCAPSSFPWLELCPRCLPAACAVVQLSVSGLSPMSLTPPPTHSHRQRFVPTSPPLGANCPSPSPSPACRQSCAAPCAAWRGPPARRRAAPIGRSPWTPGPVAGGWGEGRLLGSGDEQAAAGGQASVRGSS